jgi:hypothetical protein
MTPQQQIPHRSFHPTASIRWYCLSEKPADARISRQESGALLIEWCKKRDQMRLENQQPLCVEN